MKTFRFIILAWFATAIFCRGQVTNCGWYNGTPRDPTTLILPDNSTNAPQLTSLPGGISSYPLIGGSGNSIAEEITPEIQALADGLGDDAEGIYDYVHDNIDYVVYFGSKKGAQLTLLEKSGNDFDQAALLVALFRAAGYSANYQFGWMGVPYDATDGTHNDLHHWLKLNFSNTNWNYTSNYLFELFWNTRGYPSFDTLPGNTNTWLFQRVWVVLTEGTNSWYYDPAFKVSEPIAGINLASASGFSSNSFMSAAEGTDTGTYVRGVSEINLRATLTTYTTNLTAYMQTNCPNASMSQVLGGWQITPVTSSNADGGLLFDTYSFPTAPALDVTNWVYIPTNLMTTFSATFGGTNFQCLFPQLQGQKMSLTFDGSGNAELWLEDTGQAGWNVGTSGQRTTNVVLHVVQPFGNWNFTNNTLLSHDAFADLILTNADQRTNATYVLTYSFEPDWSWLQQRQTQLDDYLINGYSSTSREIVTETLNVMALSWMLQTEYAGHLIEQQMGILPQYHVRMGRMAQETGQGYYVDVTGVAGFMSNTGWDTANADKLSRDFDLEGYFSSALEYGIIEQLQNSSIVGASTVKMLQIANTNSQYIYLANSGNWSSVESSLANYTSSTLSNIGSLTSSGYYVLLPQNGSNKVAGTGTWGGYGYVAHLNVTNAEAETRFTISGGYNGGYSSESSAAVNTPVVDQTGDSQAQSFTLAQNSTPNPQTADPLDTADGTFEVEHADLSVGQSEPHGITLSRYYNGTRRYYNPAGMGPGWTHNYYANVSVVSAPQAGLGCTTPAQAAPMLAATCAAVGLYNDSTPDPKNWIVTALIAKWGIDQLTMNGLSFILGKDTLQFVRQPNGTFTPPANCTATATQSGSTYSLQMRHGNTLAFDSLGRLSSVTDQYGKSLSVAYVSGSSMLPETVTDWKSRTFTFNYSSGQLTSVADNTGRSISYGYNPTTGDLVSFTDTASETNTYQYDTNHQIIATFDAENRLVVSNYYDSQGHVYTQFTEGNLSKDWQVYYAPNYFTLVQDPLEYLNGFYNEYWFDNQGRLIVTIDPYDDETDYNYDGQNHITNTVSPLNETNQFVYDGNNNLIETIDPIGYSNVFVYDSQNNLTQSIDQRTNTSKFGYNAEFSLTGSTNGAGDFVNYVYNSDGTLQTRTDSAGTINYTYDSLGQLATLTYPGGAVTEYFHMSYNGDLTNHQNGRGFTTSYYYDLRRQLTNTTRPTNLVTQIFYDPEGNVGTNIDALNNKTVNTWSPTGKLVTKTLPTVAAGTGVISNAYDLRDWLASSQDPLQNPPTQYSNDFAHRLTLVTDPLQRTNAYAYDADSRRTNLINGAGQTTAQLWDARSKLIQVTDPATNIAQYSYDPTGNQMTLTNRDGKVWQFQFDGANRLTKTTSPLSDSYTQIWNHQSLLATNIRPSGATTTFLYDARNHLTNLTDAIDTIAYQYDQDENCTNVTEGGVSESSTFDAYDRLISYTDANGYNIQYLYDANGNVTNIVYPGGLTVTNFYDNLNHLVKVIDWANRQTTFTYDLDGRLTSITRPNGTVRSNYYDAAGQLTNIIEQAASRAPIAFFTMQFDNAGRVNWEFEGPLPQTNEPPAVTTTVDAENRLATVNGTTVTNDPNGNMTGAPLTNSTFATYTYDARNRLVSAGGLGYGYDALNHRLEVTNSGGGVTYFVIDPRTSQVLMRVRRGMVNYYVYGMGLLYEEDDVPYTSTNLVTYHFDMRGSTVALTDTNGNVTDHVEYSVYGMTTYRLGTNDTPFLYNGRWGVQTDTNGLLYMRARYYNPYLCRFINADPSGFSGGLNWYAFASGNPINELDPFGLFSWGKIGQGSLEVAGGILATVAVALAEAPSAGTVSVAIPTIFLGITHGMMEIGTGLQPTPTTTDQQEFLNVYPSNPGQLVGLAGYAVSPSVGENTETISGFVWDAASLKVSSTEFSSAFSSGESLGRPLTQVGVDSASLFLSGTETANLILNPKPSEQNEGSSTGKPKSE